MSSAPNANGPGVSESTTDEPAAEPPARTDVSADAALVRDALQRMETAVHDTHTTLARLRAALGDMAEVIAETKSALASNSEPAESVIERRPVDTTALLDEFEHLVDVMIEIAGGTPAECSMPAAAPQGEPLSRASEVEIIRAEDEPAQTDESSQVPTVSRVVTGRDADDDIVAAETTPPSDAVAGAPTVAMLKAMVEALNASVPMTAAEPPLAAPEIPTVGSEATAAEASETAGGIAAPTPMYREIIATPEPLPASAAPAEFDEPTVETAHAMEALQKFPAALPSDVSLSALLASVEQIETRPIPPPEIGTAVIFPPRTEPSPATQTIVPLPDAPAGGGAPLRTSSHTEVASGDARKKPSGDFDAEKFLFGPEPEPDPADFLLDPPPEAPVPEPASASAPAAELPPAAFSAPASASAPEAPAATIEQVGAPQPPPDNAPYDPLTVLNAMTAEEKIALFS